jgi:hypothetical protein
MLSVLPRVDLKISKNYNEYSYIQAKKNKVVYQGNQRMNKKFRLFFH